MAMTVVDMDCTKKAECFVNTIADANYERGYKDGYTNAIEEFVDALKPELNSYYDHFIIDDKAEKLMEKYML